MSDKIERMRLQEKCADQRAKISRLQAVVDAAREVQSSWFFRRPTLEAAMLDLGEAIRAYDGEVKP